MSYCRWSSDDYQCDVYVYEDCGGGWTTHVADLRHSPKPELPPPLVVEFEPHAWMRREAAVREILDKTPLVDIGLPHDGDTFNDPTPAACADRLESLRALGYNVPQYAIDELRSEAAEA